MSNRLLAPRRWSRSDFLSRIDVQSQCWALLDMRSAGNFRIPRSDAVMFYAVLSGRAEITRGKTGVLLLRPGDVGMVVSGEAHAVRCERAPATRVLDFLHDFDEADSPPDILLGEGRSLARVLCGTLQVCWPGEQVPLSAPAFLTLRSADNPFNARSGALERAAHGAGACAVLALAASLQFTIALREHPDFDHIYQDMLLVEPIQRARELIRARPFQPWTVEGLAKKVGMGRANFAARFMTEVGKTPMSVVIEERMARAALLLASTDLKISEISEQIGYRSESAFIRRFSTRFGVAPGKMRGQIRQAEEDQADAAREAPAAQAGFR